MTKIRPKAARIGVWKKPQPNHQSGYMRINSVHQGKRKGLYHISVVDEVTQFEVIATVERLRKQSLLA